MESRNSILDCYLKASLTANIFSIVFGLYFLFESHDRYGVFASAIFSISSIVNSIGYTHLLRWRYVGLGFVLTGCISSTIAVSLTCASWLSCNFGPIGIYLPFILLVANIGILFVLMAQKHQGKSAWANMEAGMDVRHFKHIYQLSSVVCVFIIAITCFVMPESTESDDDNSVSAMQTYNHVQKERLDAVDININELVAFEEEYNSRYQPNTRNDKISKRIFALKHLLLGGLMPELHNRESLERICKVHDGAFSREQQEILDWFLALDRPEQEEWNICPQAATLKEFKSLMERRIKQ